MTTSQHKPTLYGIILVALFSLAAVSIANIAAVKALALSPLVIGILIGVFYANTLRNRLPAAWVPGIIFCTKRILRLAIILYGFRLTFQNIQEVGLEGVVISTIMVFSTFIIAYIIGVKILKLDRDTTILIGSGSSICGAAAVLATEPVINAQPYKSIIAVSTVVIFGTISMILYPILYKAGYLGFNTTEMGLYIGGTLHEVAHVVAAGSAISPAVANDAVIVKMIRVMLIAPFLILLSLFLLRSINSDEGKAENGNKGKQKIVIPWFAVAFIGVVGFHSLHLLPSEWVTNINILDTFLLTMAMTALGMETNVKKFSGVGVKPFYLAFLIYGWLLVGGYFITKYVYAFFL